MSNEKNEINSMRYPRWWMGGVASAAACCFTQSLDTIKVHQQTQQEINLSIVQITNQIIREDGLIGLNRGLSAAILRQLTYSTFRFAFYEGGAGTVLTQPLDVIKTRRMNAQPGEFKNMWEIVLYTAKGGPAAFFKGFVLRYVRLAPHTILTFIFFEQLRLNWGILR